MRRSSLLSVVMVLLCVAGVVTDAGAVQQTKAGSQADPMGTKIWVPFVGNRGQLDPEVAFFTETIAGAFHVTRSGDMVLVLPTTGGKRAAIVESVVGTRPARARGLSRATTRIHDLRGHSARHRRNVPTYESVSLGEVYDGIAVHLRSSGKNVEKRFHVRPGSDPGVIRVAVRGAPDIQVDAGGQLVLDTGRGKIRLTAPEAYQIVDGQRRLVEVAYQVAGTTYGFRVGKYDATRELVIDPLLATYLGGSGIEYGCSIDTTTRSGPLTVYVGGYTQSSTDFSGLNGFQTTFGGGDEDGFVARLNSNFTVLDLTYLGGTDDDGVVGVQVHPETGDIFVTGYSFSDDFPGGSPVAANRGGARDAFVGRLSADLTTFVARYLGGVHNDYGYSLRVDDRAPDSGVPDTVYVVGSTNSTDFPGTAGGAQPTKEDGSYQLSDGFVARLRCDDLTLLQSSYLGGCSVDDAVAVAVNQGAELVYVGGRTGYSGRDGVTVGCFPWTDGGAWPFRGGYDAYVVRLGTALTSSPAPQATYIGGNGLEFGQALAVHPVSGSVYLAGGTGSSDFFEGDYAAIAGAYGESGGNQDAFVVRINESLTSVTEGTLFGGSRLERASDLELYPPDTGTHVYLYGRTDSWDLPDTVGGVQPEGAYEAFVVRLLGDLSSVTQATYLGGSSTDEGLFQGLSVATHPGTGEALVFVIGQTGSSDFPGVNGAVQSSPGGSLDAFVARLPGDLKGEPTADVSIAKIGPASVAPAEVYEYALGIPNAGPDDATRVAVRDVLPVGAVVTEVTPDSLCTVSPAGPIIDQQLDPTTKPDGTLEQHAGISDESHKAQTFTVDLTGQLTRIDAYIYRTSEDVTASLHIDVRRTAAGVPLEDDGDVLASATLSASEVPTTAGFLSIDVSAAGVTVTDGDVLALVLRSENDATTASPYMWEGAGSRNLYRQGSHFVRTSTYPTWTDLATVQATVSDLGFATVVTTDYAVVDCLFATVLSDDSNGVQIQVIAPAQPAAITNRASAYALEFDPDLTNNEDTADTLVGNAAPEIEVAPMSYDFGAVAQGTHSDPVEFCISNVGDADLEVSAIRNSNPSDFVLVANGGSAPCSPTRPFTLAPAAQCTFTVAYAPGDDESASGEATVESNDADEPAVVVTYSGTRQVSDGPSVSPPSRDDGGCNCTSERGPASSLGWLIVLLLVGQWRQRHQRPGKPGSSPRRPQRGTLTAALTRS